MTEQIKRGLADTGITVYRIHEIKAVSEQYYYVGKKEDIRRRSVTKKYQVTIYDVHETNGIKMKSDVSIRLMCGMSDEEIRKKLLIAKKAAEEMDVPFYEFPEAVICDCGVEKEHLKADAQQIRDIIFREDCMKGAYLSYLEIFAEQSIHHIISSYGQDIRYADSRYSGEFAINAGRPKEIEVYKDFHYNEINDAVIAAMVKDTLNLAKERTKAVKSTPSGRYDVILTDECLYKLLTMYLSKSNAENICSGYSDFQIGRCVSTRRSCIEGFNLWMEEEEPFSDEGIPMTKIKFIEDGKLLNIHGSIKYCRRAGVEPTGIYNRIYCEPGKAGFEEMKKKPYLMPALFSDFLMYGSSGNFAGEIRLAYLFDGEKISLVQGGSVSGNLMELQDQMVLSKEMCSIYHYVGPKAVRLPNVQVSGNYL